jgi:hypothetical protein
LLPVPSIRDILAADAWGDPEGLVEAIFAFFILAVVVVKLRIAKTFVGTSIYFNWMMNVSDECQPGVVMASDVQ